MFKRSVTVQTPKMATAYDSAKDHIGPALETAKESGAQAFETAKESGAQAFETAKESGSHALQAALAAMIPVVAAAAPAMAAARHKGADLLHSDAAQEARDRAALMYAAAKGEAISKKRRRWPLVIAFFALGAAVGTAVNSWLQRLSEQAPASYAEEGHAGPKVDLSHPLTETEPQPVTVLPDVTDSHATDKHEAGKHEAGNGRVEDYSDPKATF